jgi:hypothetical protein
MRTSGSLIALLGYQGLVNVRFFFVISERFNVQLYDVFVLKIQSLEKPV